MKTYSYYVLFLLVVFCGCSRPTELTSPDGNIKLVFNLNEAGAMTYGVSVGGKPFITPSVMGFEGRDGLNLSKDFQIENTEFTTKDETWTQPWGENKSIRNHYNEMAVRLKDPANTRLTLRFRVFDDGLGFRYEGGIAATLSRRQSTSIPADVVWRSFSPLPLVCLLALPLHSA